MGDTGCLTQRCGCVELRRNGLFCCGEAKAEAEGPTGRDKRRGGACGGVPAAGFGRHRDPASQRIWRGVHTRGDQGDWGLGQTIGAREGLGTLE